MARHGQVSGLAAAMTTVAMSLGSAVALGDLRILAANISVVRSGLGFSPGATIFVSSLATLTLAASVLGAGVLGDRFGMKRMFLGGAAGAVIFGLLGAAAPNVAVLMIARAGIGIAFAFLSGLSLAIMNAVFPPERRAGAIARYLAAVYAFGVIPAAVGSLLAERLGWRTGLLVTPVLAIVVAAITARYVPETPNTHRRIDFDGLALVAVALIGLTYGISRLQSAADAGAIAPIVVGLLASAAFVWWELRCDHPALDLRIFRSPRFSAVVTAGAASSLVLGGSMVMVTFFLVGIRDVSTTAFAALLIPATLLSAVAALGAGRAAKRWGNGPVVVAGLVVLAASLLVRLAFGPTTPVGAVVGVLTLTLVGGAIVQTPQATVMMSSAPVTLGGVVSAVKASVAGTFYGLGSTLFSMIGIILFTRDADTRLAGTGISAVQAGELLGATGEPAAEVDPERLAQVVEHATASMLGAARTLNLVMAAIPLLAAAVVIVLFRRARRPGQERGGSGDHARNISPVSAPQEHGQEPGLHRIVATVRAPDGPGLVVAIAQAAASTHGNIVDLQQISDPYTEEFGCRLVIDGACHTACVAEILEPLRAQRGVTFELYPDEPPPEVVVCCSSTLHCVSDLVARVTTGDLSCRITAIVSDKEAARELAEAAGIEFVHVPVGDVREDQEAALAAVLAERNPALVVLARYMRILPAWLVEQYEGRMINIHHSTLPAFPGANPRRRAHEAGVKIIGATAHYVTAGLDEGPIIAQDIAHVGNHDLEDLVRKGEDVERMVLARAVRLHLEHRIMVFGRRTSVFD